MYVYVPELGHSVNIDSSHYTLSEVLEKSAKKILGDSTLIMRPWEVASPFGAQKGTFQAFVFG